MFKFEQYVNITQENATYTNQRGQKCYQSVHGNAYTRKNKAMEQQTRKTVALYDIMTYIACFLSDWLSPKPNLPTVIKYNIPSKRIKRQNAKYEETEDFQELAEMQNIIYFESRELVALNMENGTFDPNKIKVSVLQNENKIELEYIIVNQTFNLPTEKGKYILVVDIETDKGNAQYVGNIAVQ